MPDWIVFTRGFDYDLWANKRWLPCLLGKGFPQPDTGVFGHILAAQEIWLRRLHGESLTQMPVIDLSESEMDRLHEGWTKILSAASEDRIVDYKRTTGEPNRMHLSEIARHVANHGTYHRGELRGLCRARGDEDLPETDYALFALLNPKSD